MDKLIRIETTNRVHGMLEQGGVCGRVVGYTPDTIREIMGNDVDLDVVDGDDQVPGCEGVTLRQYIEHNGYQGRVIRRGTVIQ